MNQIFKTISNECQFTREILGTGVTQLGKANYASKGSYFNAFSSITIGLERIGKMVLMLDYYLHNNKTFPTNRYIKNEIGHDLNKLYQKSQEIKVNYEGEFTFLNQLNDPIQIQILDLFTRFAKGDRYANIDLLVNRQRQSDPIKEWYETIDKRLFELRVSKRKKDRIEQNAEVIDLLMSKFTLVRHTEESGAEINSVKKASTLTGMNESIIKYRQLYVLQIIRYWVEFLHQINYKSYQVRCPEIPHLSEYFAIFYNKDKFFLTRKTYEKN